MDEVTMGLMALVKSEFYDSRLDPASFPDVSDHFLSKLFVLAQKHDLAHLAADALERHQMLPDSAIGQSFRQEIYTAFYRFELLNFTFKAVCSELEAAQICFLPLKGAVMRKHYPEPWMRTSCDIDILVHKEDLPRAEERLIQALQFTRLGIGSHEITLQSPNGTRLELHYELVEENRANSSSYVLQQVWNHVHPISEHCSEHEMDESMFFFYHIAHMAKHFESGGCGIRTFLDLWLLLQSGVHTSEQTIKFLEQGNLSVFAVAAQRLVEVWFMDYPHDNTTQLMQSYILSGGIFGSLDQYFSVKQTRCGGKMNIITSRLILPYEKLKYQYPRLEKYPWLMPVYELIRAYELLFGKKKQFRQTVLASMNGISEQQLQQTAKLLDLVGL